MDRRVVVTGMGAISPVGNSVPEFWESIKNGKCGIDFITNFDNTGMKVKVAGEVKNFDPAAAIDKKEVKRMDRYSQFAVAAASEAMNMSGIDAGKIDKERFGVMVGSGIGGLGTIEEQVIKMHEKGPSKVAPLFIPMAIINMAAGNIAIRFGARGTCTSTVTACATSTNCIGEAFRNIKHGYSDVIIAGGAEASVTKIGIAGFSSLKALSTSDDPKRASIPFDAQRHGFVMGEGAGILILEELEHALKRGADIYAEIAGYGSTCDANHITAPLSDGDGARAAMKAAMDESGAGIYDITYINAHGTSTTANDSAETEAIKNLFKEQAYNIPVSSTKSMTGHLLGATGAIEAIATIEALINDFAPPTAGLKTPGEGLDLNYVPGKGIEKEMKYALSNTLGFGGHNAVLCIKKWEGR